MIGCELKAPGIPPQGYCGKFCSTGACAEDIQGFLSIEGAGNVGRLLSYVLMLTLSPSRLISFGSGVLFMVGGGGGSGTDTFLESYPLVAAGSACFGTRGSGILAGGYSGVSQLMLCYSTGMTGLTD